MFEKASAKDVLRMLLVISILFAVGSCDEEVEPIIDPILGELEVETAQLDQVWFSSSIDEKGTYDIEDHGFIYSKQTNPSYTNGTVVSLGENSTKSKFRDLISNLEVGTEYFGVAYLEFDDRVIYGEEKSFNTQNVPFPSFYPKSAGISNYMQFSYNTGQLLNASTFKIFIGDILAPGIYDIESDTRRFKLRIPEGLEPNIDYKVTMQVGSSIIESEYTFRFLEGEWINKKDFEGITMNHPVSFVIGNYGYICGSNQLWKYDYQIDQWLRQADFPGVAELASSSFTIEGKGYVIGGHHSDANYSNEVWRYNPELDQWEQLNNFPGHIRSHAVAFNSNTYGYYGLGRYRLDSDNDEVFGDFWRYEPQSDQWVQIENFPGGNRSHASAIRIDEKVYVGYGGHPFKTDSYSDFYSFDLLSETWEQIPSPPNNDERYNSSIFKTGQSFVVGGGQHTGAYYGDFYKYNTVEERWYEVAQPDDQLINGAVLTINERTFFALGRRVYDPASYDYTKEVVEFIY